MVIFLIPIELLGCEEPYSFYTTTEPTSAPLRNISGMTCTCPECTHEIRTTVLNQTCSKTVTVQSCTNTITIPPLKYISTTSVCPSPTTKLISKRIETTIVDVISTKSLSICLPASERPILLNFVIPAAGGLVGLLIVLLLAVITGWVCTCRIMKKRGKMEINTMQDRYYFVVQYCLEYTVMSYVQKCYTHTRVMSTFDTSNNHCIPACFCIALILCINCS